MAAILGGVLGPSALQVAALDTTHEAAPAPTLPRVLEEQTAQAWVLAVRHSSVKSPTAQVFK